MARNGSRIVVLVVADNVANEVHYFLVFLCDFRKELDEIVFLVLIEICHRLLTHFAEPFIELLRRVLILLDFHMPMVHFDEGM
jgi:hypothetical protein